MLSNLSREDIDSLESKLEEIRSRFSEIRQRMSDDGMESFAANVRMFRSAVSDAEKCSLRIQQSYERRLLESSD